MALSYLEEGRARSILDTLTGNGALAEKPEEMTALLLYKRRPLIGLRALPPTEITDEEKRELQSLEQELHGDDKSISYTKASQTSVTESLKFPSIFNCISPDTVVVELGFSRLGSTILAVDASGVEFAQKYPFRDVDIRTPILKALNHINVFAQSHQDASRSSLDAWLMEISDKIISPLASIIRRKHHIVFSVAQPLTAFPFGALIIGDQPLALTVAVSVTPSLAAYHQLSAKTAAFAPTVTTIAKPGSKSV